VDNLCSTGHSLCTACGESCGNKKTLELVMALTCGNIFASMWSKYFFWGISSTASAADYGQERRHGSRQLILHAALWQ